MDKLSAFEHALQSAGFPLQMKAQRQIVDMAERIGGQHPCGMLADAREQHVAKLHEADHRQARNAIGEDQGERQPRVLPAAAPLPGCCEMAVSVSTAAL